MSSMVDEPQIPPTPAFFICPCCKFSFITLPAFIAHCDAMKRTIDEAIANAKRPVKK